MPMMTKNDVFPLIFHISTIYTYLKTLGTSMSLFSSKLMIFTKNGLKWPKMAKILIFRPYLYCDSESASNQLSNSIPYDPVRESSIFIYSGVRQGLPGTRNEPKKGPSPTNLLLDFFLVTKETTWNTLAVKLNCYNLLPGSDKISAD